MGVCINLWVFDYLLNVLTICFKSWPDQQTFKKDFTLILSILKIIIILNSIFYKIILLPLPWDSGYNSTSQIP